LGKAMKLTALNKLLSFPMSAFLSGKWERCEGGLFGNKEYEKCRAASCPWVPILTRGEFGNSNNSVPVAGPLRDLFLARARSRQTESRR
jgi:hypothetical protein